MGESVPELQVRLRKTVVLIGMMGAGKTAVGRALATRLGVPMRDSDAEIVERARLSINEIFERYGEPFFREKETQVIERLLEGEPCILSTGGGAWMSERNRALLTEKAAVLWLEADLDLLWNRVRHKSTRPLLRTQNPHRTLSEMLEARTPVYRLAPLKIHVEAGWSIAETAERVLRRLVEAGAAEEVAA
ncbi:shikimate kinase [Roseibacterium sp. SDUM158016]|uniref:shikimate kinase n=1 Tax=Roseicyclus sediminis TaxID=2980997 RepID=UPI0021CF2AB3|nr:shikimate kinase [Roseibacterium sp. SDUM158016]MCU4654209.1 shikimate kinase [Roseibacterium sp. SDUM158016]